MKKILGDIEEQVVTVLQNFYVKTEAKLKEEASRDGPISARKASLTKVRAEGAMLAPTAPSTTTTTESIENTLVPPSTTPVGVDYRVSSNQRTGAEPLQSPTNFKAVSAFVSKDQPYRYAGLRPPHLSLEELKKKDNVEEEYPLTYDELKSKVWHTDVAQ